MSRRSLATVLSLLSLTFVATAGAEDLSQVLTRFDAVQLDVRDLSADFIMTTESSLLKDKLVSTGRIYMSKPDAVRWEFDSPEHMRFVIAENEYTGYFPEQNRAEKRDIGRWREQLFRFLGLGQASGELSRFYDISLAEDAEVIPGTICLNLDPKKQRVKKRMDSVRFWIGATTFLPIRVEYRSKLGDRRTIDFAGMDVNPELAANLYVVELPDGVEITRGFSAFSGFGPTTTN